jgi:hypothetical protein
MKIRNLFLSIVCIITGSLITRSQENEAVVPFKEGTISICSTKNFIIRGYDGNEDIAKADNKNTSDNKGKDTDSVTRGIAKMVNRNYWLKADTLKTGRLSYAYPIAFFDNKKRSEGLKKLGTKATNREKGIYLTVEQSGNELIIKDDQTELFVMTNEDYELLIPNSTKLRWNSSDCNIAGGLRYMGKSWKLSDYTGEVEISSQLTDLHLKDVKGPVSINTIGANVTVEFLKTKPSSLYSIYSNNGFIDISFAQDSNVNIDAKGNEIFSDLPVKITAEDNTETGQHLKMTLNKARTKMIVDAGRGNIYLRKN